MPTYRLTYEDKPYTFQSLFDAQEFLDKLPSRGEVEILDGPKLFRLLNAPGAPWMNWREIIDEINEEFGEAKTEGMRESLLATFSSTMNIVETMVEPEKLAEFQESRRKHYKSFIVQEALVGGSVCVETLHAVTDREVAAGRMAPDDNLRKLALYGVIAPHSSRAEHIAKDAEKRGLPVASTRQSAWAWMPEGPLNWFRASVVVPLRGRSEILQYGRRAIREYWSENPEITQGFPDKFVKSEARDIMEEVVKIATSPDPRMANRKCLALRAREWARFQVLMLDRHEEDVTGLCGRPGITGELKEHLLYLAQKDDDLREFIQTFGPIGNWDDVWNAVVAKCRVTYAWAHVFHMLRVAFDDLNRGNDWFKPFVAAMCAWQEHNYRKSLGLLASLPASDIDADLRSLAMSAFESCVLEGFPDPEAEWHRRLVEVKCATKAS